MARSDSRDKQSSSTGLVVLRANIPSSSLRRQHSTFSRRSQWRRQWMACEFWKTFRRTTINTSGSKWLTLSLNHPALFLRGKMKIGEFIEALRTGRTALANTSGGGSVIADTVVNSVMVTRAYRNPIVWRIRHIVT